MRQQINSPQAHRPAAVVAPRARSFQIESIGVPRFLVEHDLFGKPASTPDHVRGRLFPDHALVNYLLKKKPRPLVLRIAEEFLWLVDFHDLSVVHEDDA